ncbi:MAG: GGDEF domain-containing protein [Gemmatimonadaceae bacterium]
MPVRVLVITSPDCVTRLDGLDLPVSKRGAPRFTISYVDLTQGLEMLGSESGDVVVLELPSSHHDAIRALSSIRNRAPDAPILVLTEAGNEAMGLEAVRQGASDHLVRGQFDDGLLARALMYAIERSRVQSTLRQLSLTDQLTGLYNRRGFIALSEHHTKLAGRTRGLLFVRAKLEELDRIATRFGDVEAERALTDAAEVLRVTFRVSDVIARLTEGEFAVLVLDATEDAMDAINPRLQQALSAYNSASGRAYTLSFQLLASRFEPEQTRSIADLIGPRI